MSYTVGPSTMPGRILLLIRYSKLINTFKKDLKSPFGKYSNTIIGTSEGKKISGRVVTPPIREGPKYYSNYEPSFLSNTVRSKEDTVLYYIHKTHVKVRNGKKKPLI